LKFSYPAAEGDPNHPVFSYLSVYFNEMVQAVRSGKQNIIEASVASATSKEMEIKLRA